MKSPENQKFSLIRLKLEEKFGDNPLEQGTAFLKSYRKDQVFQTIACFGEMNLYL